MKKQRTQRAILTLTDDNEGGYKAHVEYEPSALNRVEDSPALNAMVRLSIIISKHTRELAAPLIEKKEIVITDL